MCLQLSMTMPGSMESLEEEWFPFFRDAAGAAPRLRSIPKQRFGEGHASIRTWMFLDGNQWWRWFDAARVAPPWLGGKFYENASRFPWLSQGAQLVTLHIPEYILARDTLVPVVCSVQELTVYWRASDPRPSGRVTFPRVVWPLVRRFVWMKEPYWYVQTTTHALRPRLREIYMTVFPRLESLAIHTDYVHLYDWDQCTATQFEDSGVENHLFPGTFLPHLTDLMTDEQVLVERQRSVLRVFRGIRHAYQPRFHFANLHTLEMHHALLETISWDMFPKLETLIVCYQIDCGWMLVPPSLVLPETLRAIVIRNGDNRDAIPFEPRPVLMMPLDRIDEESGYEMAYVQWLDQYPTLLQEIRTEAIDCVIIRRKQ